MSNTMSHQSKEYALIRIRNLTNRITELEKIAPDHVMDDGRTVRHRLTLDRGVLRRWQQILDQIEGQQS